MVCRHTAIPVDRIAPGSLATVSAWWWHWWPLTSRARICKRLRGPGIDSKESIPPAYVARQAGTTNRVIILDHQLHRLADSFLVIHFWAPSNVYKFGIWLLTYSRAGIFKQNIGARNRVGIGLSYRPASKAGIFKQSIEARNRVGMGLSYRPARLYIYNMLAE